VFYCTESFEDERQDLNYNNCFSPSQMSIIPETLRYH